MSSIDKTYQKAAIDLKRLGLIDYDLRFRLSSAQKGRITLLKKEYGHAIKHPEAFHIATVGKARAKELRGAGFKVTPKNKAVIPLHEYTSAKIKKGMIEFKAGRMTEKVILSNSDNFHQKAFALSQRKLKKNEMLTARIGNNGPFLRARFVNYADLYHYVNHVFQAKDPGESTNRIRGLMSIVILENQKSPPRKKPHAQKKGRA